MHQNYSLSNRYLSIQVNSVGAELRSIFDHEQQLEYIWQRDATFWGKSSPVLFPAVGNFKGNCYTHAGQNFAMGKHGFARDQVFTLKEQLADTLVFELRDNAASRTVYPFSFSLLICYHLVENRLQVRYQIRNLGEERLYFGFGVHPAFALSKAGIPLGLADYTLLFPEDEQLSYRLLESDLLAEEMRYLPLKKHGLQLSHALFHQDALICSGLKSRHIVVRTAAAAFKFEWKGFPYFGLWSSKSADFFCLEPWASLPDSSAAAFSLASKSTLHVLAPNARFKAQWIFQLLEV